ncbi:hypothetical protein ABKV19_000779 [Rosa sericea]
MDQSGSVPSGRKAKDVKVPDQSGSGNPPRRKANEVKDQSRSGIPSGRKAKDVKVPAQSGSGNPPGRKANVVKDQSGSGIPSGRKARDVKVPDRSGSGNPPGRKANEVKAQSASEVAVAARPVEPLRRNPPRTARCDAKLHNGLEGNLAVHRQLERVKEPKPIKVPLKKFPSGRVLCFRSERTLQEALSAERTTLLPLADALSAGERFKDLVAAGHPSLGALTMIALKKVVFFWQHHYSTKFQVSDFDHSPIAAYICKCMNSGETTVAAAILAARNRCRFANPKDPNPADYAPVLGSLLNAVGHLWALLAVENSSTLDDILTLSKFGISEWAASRRGD